MTVKRILATLLLVCITATLLGGCAQDEPESTISPPSTDGGETNPDLIYHSEKLSFTGEIEDLSHIVSSRDRLFLSDGDKLYSMDRNAVNIQDVSAYAPLDEYRIAMLGTAFGGGLLVLEENNESYIISHVAKDGSVDSVTDITQSIERFDNSLPRKLFLDMDGNLYFQMDDGTVIISSDDESSYNLSLENNSEFVSIALSGSGTAYVCVHEILNSVYTVYELNTNGTLGKLLCEMPESTLTPQLINGGESFGLLYNDGETLYSLDTENGRAELLFEWVNHGLSGPFVFDILDVSDRVLVCRYYTGELYIFEEGSEPERTILKLATYEENYFLSIVISEFNMTSDKYRVIVEDYSKYDEGLPGAGLMKLNTEIQAGNIPDIIDFAHIPPNDFESKGLLIDLYPFIDADPGIDRSDLLAPYIRAFEHEGALYQALMFFGIEGFVGKSDIVGPEHGWTLDEMISLQVKYAPNAPGMGGLSKGEAATRYINSIYEEFIDWETGNCSFNSNNFVQIPEYLATLDENEEKSRVEHVLNGDAITSPISLHHIFVLMSYDAAFGDEEYTIKGYPTNGKSGIVCNYYNSPALGITTACSNKDGAWSFVRTLFSEFVSDIGIGLPISKKALNAINTKMMIGTEWTNEKGQEVKTIWWGMVDNETKKDILLDAATQEQVDRFYELINVCDLVWKSDSSVTDIIHEELRAFFAGNKTAQEAADIIQSRVQIYVAEQSR